MKFEIFQSESNSKYYFRLKAKNGQIILQSKAYDSSSDVKAAIEGVRKAAKNDSAFETKEDANGKFRFSLKNADGSSLGHSQGYASKATMNNGINSVKNVAGDAAVVEL